ncbi:hypothetical protein M3Y99_01157600 [Aphelenchoides fujianensis]|nr:hypothetical protein M3Y99_01157600 [Aphelenchoides fujianensis]
MTDLVHTNGDFAHANGKNGAFDSKPLLELYVKASGIDSRRIGADLFCAEFWMELYALFECGVVRVEVKTVNVNSEAYKKSFLGAQPPILVEPGKNMTYTDNREIESRIFHLAKEFNVPLFEKDPQVDKNIQNLYRNFKIFLQAKADFDKQQRKVTPIEQTPPQVVATYNRVVEQLAGIDEMLRQRKSRYLSGDSMTEYDCELMPRLHHMRVVGEHILGFEIPHSLVHLWSYILTAYRTAAFLESCPADQDIVFHYKEQLRIVTSQRETLLQPTKTHGVPADVMQNIRKLNLQ